MPLSAGSYGYGSYGSSPAQTLDTYRAVSSYARPYYAQSERREIKTKPDTCGPSPSTCPVCEDYINLDIIGRFCSLEGAYTVKSKEQNELNDKESNDSTSTCTKGKVEEVFMGEKRHGKKDIRISSRKGCSCPQLNSNDEIIVLTSRAKNISQGRLIADSEVYIVPKTESNVADIADLKERCNY